MAMMLVKEGGGSFACCYGMLLWHVEHNVAEGKLVLEGCIHGFVHFQLVYLIEFHATSFLSNFSVISLQKIY